MKYRQAFVSNSSSASFVVWKRDLTGAEAAALLAYGLSEENEDCWNIYEDGDRIRGTTIMDNDALDDYLEKIQFDFSKMVWCE